MGTLGKFIKMKLIPILLFSGFLCMTGCNPVFGITKHALLIGIGNYPGENGWPKISSLRDLDYLQATLLNQGFQKENIKTIKDEAATIKGISEAFIQLINEVKPGDIVVIHFSCHGEQVKADNNNKIDGLDECIVSYNAISPLQSTDFEKDQALYFRGHQLGSYIGQLRTKLGKTGDVMVFLDYCHSGSGTRGLGKIRGGKPPLVPKGFDINTFHKASDSSSLFRENATQKGESNELAGFVVISATRPEELDAETMDDKGEGIGSLTYAICKSFERLNPGTTYRSLFASIQATMNIKVPSQHPLLEGNETDRLILGGSFIVQKPYIEITRFLNDKRILVKAGLLSGLDSGSKVSIYPSGTHDPSGSVSLATGIVIQSDSYSATVQLDKELSIEEPANEWCFVTQMFYHINPVHIEIRSDHSGSPEKNLSRTEIVDMQTSLRKLPFVIIDENPELQIARGAASDSIIIASNGYLFSTISHTPGTSNELNEKIQQYAQYKFLEEINLSDNTAKFDVKLVPFVNGKADSSLIRTKIIAGLYEFKNGDSLVLWVRNTGGKPAYINILDMQPDGVINPLLPNKTQNIYSHDLKMNPGDSHLFTNYLIVVSPPYGTEILKIFASTSEIDLEGIAATRGISKGGNFSILENLVKNSFDLSKGVTIVNPENANGSTYNLLFRIKP
jgi:metacaspase-1